MDVFISWSGSLSHEIAQALEKWLKQVIHAVEPFVSSEIERGGKWFTIVSRKLESSSVGIICLTGENLHSDWLLFEAGALAKRMKKSKVCPLLIELAPSEVGAPLSQFQCTTLTKLDMKRLIESINKSLGRNKLPERFLDEQFERFWPELEMATQTALHKCQTAKGTMPSSALSSLVLQIIYREINLGQIEEIHDWFDFVRGHQEVTAHAEIRLVQATLARFGGKRNAVTLLEQLSTDKTPVSQKARFELAVLKYSMFAHAVELVEDWNAVSVNEASLKKLWCSLIAMAFLRERNFSEATRFFESCSPTVITEGPCDTYSAIPLAILSAALENHGLTERYLDIAEKGGGLRHRSADSYPLFPLVRRHDCGFVRNLLGVSSEVLSDDWIKLLRGYSHTLAAHTRVLRGSPAAIETFVKMSSRWPKLRIDKFRVADRLRNFENRLFEKAGTLLGPA